MRGIIEGPIEETSYYFPAEKIKNYIGNLPPIDYSHSQKYIRTEVKDKIVLIFHDEFYDAKLAETELYKNIHTTCFLLTKHLRHGVGAYIQDVQFHFDKTRLLKTQIEEYKGVFGDMPIANRTHRPFWRADIFDLSFLSLNGVLIDCTTIGETPFILYFEGKVLPIWELPTSINGLSLM